MFVMKYVISILKLEITFCFPEHFRIKWEQEFRVTEKRLSGMEPELFFFLLLTFLYTEKKNNFKLSLLKKKYLNLKNETIHNECMNKCINLSKNELMHYL